MKDDHVHGCSGDEEEKEDGSDRNVSRFGRVATK
jgi:hypothetical protein